jgi:hypothetical protein
MISHCYASAAQITLQCICGSRHFVARNSSFFLELQIYFFFISFSYLFQNFHHTQFSVFKIKITFNFLNYT